MHLKLEKLEQTFQPSTLTKIEDQLLDDKQIELWIKRDDLLHPVISGNKWRKLKYILDFVLTANINTVVSMGGAYSNHLHALAYASRLLGLDSMGFVRGEQPSVLNQTLQDLQQWGMTLKFLSRSEYKELRLLKNQPSIPELPFEHYWLPEGGAQRLALKGVGELVKEIIMPFDTLCLPCGTGTTLAGVAAASQQKFSVLGFSALKNADFLRNDIETLMAKSVYGWQINQDYHFGGFAKNSAELIAFIELFEQKTSISLDHVYTGKMMYGLYDLIKQGYFAAGHRIVALHTGGLQGKRDFID
jgi:1-aminocyclopropane-1-carboxylate deaminase